MLGILRYRNRMVGIFGILLALGTLMYLAYRGLNVLFLAPLMALVACLFHPGTPLLASYTQIFMPALGQYLVQYFPIFALGAIFGRVMNESGAAYRIARFITARLGPKQAILSVILACALLTYGGVSLFVVAFTIYPIALALFQQSNTPRRLIPAAIALGSFTFTMTALPGTPAIQNAIPMPVFGTTSFAAPLIGCVASAIMFGFGYLWLRRREGLARERGEGFSSANATVAQGDRAEISPEIRGRLPTLFAAILPLLLVVLLNYLFSKVLFPSINTSYLADPRFGSTALTKVLGTWSLVASLAIALVVALVLYRGYFENLVKVINEGTFSAMLPIFNTASEVGFGATIASLTSFEAIKGFLLGIAPGSPLVSLAISVNALAGITGSASGGLSIALGALGKTYVERAQTAHIPMEVMHRIAAIACCGLDALPHNGAVITLLTICGLTHRQSYFDIFMTAVVGTTIANIVAVTMGVAFY